ncbi:MAG: leucine-rich repeat domain-containing protein [Eubacterium sp.]|nr:leucine-rich repeat domain-containing protein [Eubacterium sp.]
MKRTISILLSLLMLLSSTPLSGLIAFAEEGDASGQVDENISWSFDAATKTLTFTGEGRIPSWTIPSTVNKDDIENLVYADGIVNSYYNNGNLRIDSLKTITFGKSFWIEPHIFGNGSNSSLEAIYVSEDNTSFCSVDGVLYSKHMDRLIKYPAAKSGSVVALPESVVTIENGAFSGNVYAKYIEFGPKVTSIISGAFSSCQSLKYVEIPEKVTVLFSGCFSGCKELSEVFIPKSVNSILGNPFINCPKLTTIKVDPENECYVSSSNALYTSDYKTLLHFPNLKQICTINNNTKRIAEYAFYNNQDIEKVVLSEALEYIDDYAFSGCTSLKEVTKSESLLSIGEGAFEGCTSLKEVTSSESLLSIGDHSFKNCTSLETFGLPDTIQTIGQQAFLYSGLRYITLPRTLETIDNAVLNSRLDELTVLNPDFVFPGYNSLFGLKPRVIKGFINSTAQEYAAQYGSDFVCLCTNGTENHDYEETVVEPTADEKGYTLYTCKTCGYNYKSNVIKADEIVYTNGGRTLVSYSPELTDDTFVVPDTVNVISDDAFNNEYLKTVVVSSNVKVIGNSAFENCPNLESVEFSDDAQLEQIESSAFAGTNIQTVVVPESVKSVKSKAFANCIKLDSFDVEETLRKLLTTRLKTVITSLLSALISRLHISLQAGKRFLQSHIQEFPTRSTQANLFAPRLQFTT